MRLRFNVFGIGRSSTGGVGEREEVWRTRRHRVCDTAGNDCRDLHFVDGAARGVWHTGVRPEAATQGQLNMYSIRRDNTRYKEFFFFNFEKSIDRKPTRVEENKLYRFYENSTLYA